jgi:hypothetical protein
MIAHISIGVRDIDRSKRFYDAAPEPLGYKCPPLHPVAAQRPRCSVPGKGGPMSVPCSASMSARCGGR